MPTYRIPLVWEEYGHVIVTAPTEEEAIEYALGPKCALPEGHYVDDSICVDENVEIEVWEDNENVVEFEV